MKTNPRAASLEFADFFNEYRKNSFLNEAAALEEKTRQKMESANHGDFADWLRVLAEIPPVKPSSINLNAPAIQIGLASDLTGVQKTGLEQSLKKLHPWRKGPFELFGIFIDTEWKSNLKWDRVIQSIKPLRGRAVLDLGCGNGYYLWRMAGCHVKLAMGVDPSLHYAVQFQVFQKYANDPRLALLPLGVEDLPQGLTGFDTIFSMGLLYHRRDPEEHLKHILGLMREGGEMVLETLVIEGAEGEILKPGERYAKMRNVWNIPSCKTAEHWLKQAGFKNIRCVDKTLTTRSEQRKTEWMQFESLDDFLDPKDSFKTAEGYPAPKRAIFIAQK